MENKTTKIPYGQLTKEPFTMWTCRKCSGDEFTEADKKAHNCEANLLKRKMKFGEFKKIERMTDAEYEAALKAVKPAKTEPKDNKDAILAYKRVCESVLKQCDQIRSRTELLALVERFTTADKKYNEACPESKDILEFAQAAADKLQELDKKFKK
jgi:hypothetical protein